MEGKVIERKPIGFWNRARVATALGICCSAAISGSGIVDDNIARTAAGGLGILSYLAFFYFGSSSDKKESSEQLQQVAEEVLSPDTLPKHLVKQFKAMFNPKAHPIENAYGLLIAGALLTIVAGLTDGVSVPEEARAEVTRGLMSTANYSIAVFGTEKKREEVIDVKSSKSVSVGLTTRAKRAWRYFKDTPMAQSSAISFLAQSTMVYEGVAGLNGEKMMDALSAMDPKMFGEAMAEGDPLKLGAAITLLSLNFVWMTIKRSDYGKEQAQNQR